MTIKPRSAAPTLDLPTVGGGRLVLAESRPAAFSMLVFYRGLHCPTCKSYLRDLDRKQEEFAQRGVSVVAISTDEKVRAERSKAEWNIAHLSLPYGMSIEQAREWGLFISAGIKEDEPPLFAEPGLFLVCSDGTLYAASIQSMPFARPHFADVLAAVEFIVAKNYPARGEA